MKDLSWKISGLESI